jgi:hypothetical protein
VGSESIVSFRRVDTVGEPSVFVHTDRFKDVPQYTNSARLNIAPKSDSALELLLLAMKGLDRVHHSGFQIRKAG